MGGTGAGVVGSSGVEVIGVEQRLLGQLADMDVVGGVELAVAVPSHPHEAAQAQLGQMLGHRRRLGADVGSQLVDRVLPVQESPQDPQPGHIGEQLQGRHRQLQLLVGGLLDYLRIHAATLAPPERRCVALSETH